MVFNKNKFYKINNYMYKDVPKRVSLINFEFRWINDFFWGAIL